MLGGKTLGAFGEERTAFGNLPPLRMQCASSTIMVQILFEKFSSVRILQDVSCSSTSLVRSKSLGIYHQEVPGAVH